MRLHKVEELDRRRVLIDVATSATDNIFIFTILITVFLYKIGILHLRQACCP